MQKTAKGEAAAELNAPGMPEFKLNYSDPGAPILVEDIAGLYQRIRDTLAKPEAKKKAVKTEADVAEDGEDQLADDGEDAASEEGGVKIFADNVDIFGAVTRYSGTHILKIHSQNAQDHVLNFPAVENSNRSRRIFPSMNAGWGAYAKIVYQPVAVMGHDGAASLFDHIKTPGELSPLFLASFVAAFSQESLDAIIEGINRPKSGVKELHFENFPIVYLPDGQGGELQVTPISPLEAFGNFKSAVLKKGESLKSPLTTQEISSKMQNVSTAIGGGRMRFRAMVPNAMRSSEAAIWRYAQGGRIPSIPGDEVTELLDAFQDLHASRESLIEGEEGAYFNSNMGKGALRLAGGIIRLAKEWIDDVNQGAARVNPAFEAEGVDMRQLLLSSWRGARDKKPEDRNAAREAVRRALHGIIFMRAMKEELL